MKHKPEENHDDLETLRNTEGVGHWIQKDFSDHPGTDSQGTFEYTHRARIGWKCAFCEGMLFNPCAKAVFEGSTICNPCYNRKLERRGEEKMSFSQFKSFAKKQYNLATEGVELVLKGRAPRSGQNPKRSWEENDRALRSMSEAEHRQMEAVLDYVAIFAEGIAGYYLCRNDYKMSPGRIHHMVIPVFGPDGKPIKPKLRYYDAKPEEEGGDGSFRCCDLIMAMNHWYKDTKDTFRCPWCGEKYKRWAEKGSTASPGYFLMLYGPHQETFYIRAVPPSTEQDNLLNIVKLLMDPKDILALFRHANQLREFDAAINKFCAEEFAECASYCKQAIIRLEKVGDFMHQTCDGCLDTSSFGHEIPAIAVEKARTCKDFFSSEEWDDLLKALLRRLFVGDISEETWKELSPGKKRTLNRLCTGTTGPKNTYVRPTDEPQRPTLTAPQVLTSLGDKVPAKKGEKPQSLWGAQSAPDLGDHGDFTTSDDADGWQDWEKPDQPWKREGANSSSSWGPKPPTLPPPRTANNNWGPKPPSPQPPWTDSSGSRGPKPPSQPPSKWKGWTQH